MIVFFDAQRFLTKSSLSVFVLGRAGFWRPVEEKPARSRVLEAHACVLRVLRLYCFHVGAWSVRVRFRVSRDGATSQEKRGRAAGTSPDTAGLGASARSGLRGPRARIVPRCSCRCPRSQARLSTAWALPVFCSRTQHRRDPRAFGRSMLGVRVNPPHLRLQTSIPQRCPGPVTPRPATELPHMAGGTLWVRSE